MKIASVEDARAEDVLETGTVSRPYVVYTRWDHHARFPSMSMTFGELAPGFRGGRVRLGSPRERSREVQASTCYVHGRGEIGRTIDVARRSMICTSKERRDLRYRVILA